MKQEGLENTNQKKVRTLLVGTTEFAAKIFQEILTFEYLEVVGVITQPDKVVGRKREVHAPPVKILFQKISQDIPRQIPPLLAPLSKDRGILYQPVKFKLKYEKILEETKPELIIVCAYGKILPVEFLNYPKFKCLNIHGSILPKYRGATPIQTTVLNGDSEAGVTLQVMKYEMDEGDIVSSTSISIDNTTITVPTLFEMLVEPTVKMLRESLPKYLSGELIPIPQNPTHASYCYISDFEYVKGGLDFSQSALQIDRKVRAFNPEPGSWVRDMTINSKKIEGVTKIIEGKVFDLEEFEIDSNTKVGECIVENKKLVVKCENGFYEIKKIQPAGKKIMEVRDFLNGFNKSQL